MTAFQYDIPTRIEFGEGIYREVLCRLPELRGKRVLMVSTGRSLRRLGYIDALLDALKEISEPILYEGVSANPRLHEVAEAVALGKAEQVEAVLGFGGGSAIDAAKLTAAALLSDRDLEDLFEHNIDPAAPRLPLVAMPTTAGSGSEVSQSAIISHGAQKRSVRGRCLFPDVAVVDPQFTWQIPWNVTAETGFDVFAHAVEALVSVKANPYSEMLSYQVAGLVLQNLPVLKNVPQDAQARANMSFASLLMGLNLTLAGTLLPHRLQYPIGAEKNNSHGAGLLALFPAWLELEYPSSREKLDKIAGLTGCSGDSVSAIVRFIESLSVRKNLAEMGFDPEDADKLTDEVNGKLDNDPAYRGRETIKQIYQKSFE